MVRIVTFKIIDMQSHLRMIHKSLEELAEQINIEPYMTSDFWEMPASSRYYGVKWDTPAMYALSMGHYHVVEYLEKEKGAKLHTLVFNQQTEFKSMNTEFARKYLDSYF